MEEKAYGYCIEVYLHEPIAGVHPHPTQPSKQAYKQAADFIEKHLQAEIGLPVSVIIKKSD